MKSHLNRKVWLQYIVPLTIISIANVTQELSVITDGSYSRVYGFPLPFVSEGWLTSFHHSVFIGPFLFDFLTYLIFWIIIAIAMQKIGLTLRTNLVSIILIWFVVLALVLFHILFLFDDTYTLGSDLDFVIQSRAIKWGLYP